MNRRFIVVSISILGAIFVVSQFYGFKESQNQKVQQRHKFIEWKFTQKEIKSENATIETNTTPILETSIPDTPTEIPSEQPTSPPITNATFHLFDLPYPSPAKHRTEGETLTTHIPIPDDELVATFRAKYKEYHDNMYTGRKRFIVWQKIQTWGLGNRIEGLLTTILVGLLTDRAIIIDDPLIEELVDWPWLFSYGKANQKAYLLGPRYVASNDECYFLDKGFGRDYEHEDFSKKWPSSVLVFECNCPGFHWITRNPLYFETLRRLGAIPPESAGIPKEDYSFYVASWLSRMFFGKINTKYQTIIDEYVNSWNTQKTFVIGFQIRMGGNGDASFMTTSELERAISCAKDMAKGRSNVKYLVASDTPSAIQRISSYFGADNVIVVTGTPKHVAMQYVDDNDMVKLVIDNWLLSEVDELIITPQSTFGAVASFRGGKLPMYVLYDQCEKAAASYGPGGHWEGMLLW